MTLPARELRILDGMEAALLAGETHLMSMFAIFARLATDEAKPWMEEVGTRPGGPRGWLAVLRVAGRQPWNARGRPASRGQRGTRRRTRKLRVIALIPVALAALASAVLMSVSTTGVRGCRPAIAVHSAERVLSRARACPSPPPVPVHGGSR
jgi:hypothetical protein